MLRIQYLKILYALAGLLWAGNWSWKLLAYHLSDRVPISLGTVLCLLLFVSVPAFGYVVLFRLFPLAGRLLKR